MTIRVESLEFPTSAAHRRLTSSLGIIFVFVAGISLVLSFQRDLVSFGLQLLVAAIFFWGIFAQFPIGYSINGTEFVIRTYFRKRVIPLAEIHSVTIKNPTSLWFEKLTGCQGVVLSTQRHGMVEVYSEAADSLCQKLKTQIARAGREP